ncbi:MAG: hypothetical protein KKE62_01750 [Proteobacteria bacterium]|nr:hypothetical protein [Pseudomonadota bacterium]MBU1387138.1 hypothetical protein [Pseudomonadota bacterium]MBU1541545.1 hypothetical protein [Pseudomonadota bacterium]MBU2430256.1 hypothetical protein [Pseudomonadota bacterium]MBU2480051.1 hypothetical protein [Pseudomonadota bacterium]
MKKIISGVIYDTSHSVLIVESETYTTFSGKILSRLFKTHDGKWFQTIKPKKENKHQSSNTIGPDEAKQWLEKHSFSLELQIYFSSEDYGCKPDRQVMVAEWTDPAFPVSMGGKQVERLYYAPGNEWMLSITREAELIPIRKEELSGLLKTQHFQKQ